MTNKQWLLDSRPAAEATVDNFRLVEADICDRPRMATLFGEFKPDGVMHLAAQRFQRLCDECPTELTAFSAAA